MRMTRKKALFLLLISLAVLLVVGCSSATDEEPAEADPGEDLAAISNRFEAGAFEDPSSCAGCHTDIHEAWAGSMHANAWDNEFYQPDYLAASIETEGFTDIFCGECHAPVAVRTEQLPPTDGSLFDQTSMKGVSCDYCHTVSEVIEPVNVQTISDPGNVKRGPRGDGQSPYHEVKFSEVHTDAAFCGACHSVQHPLSGVAVIDTYDDWKAGPYAEEGTRCQDCHMSPTPGVAQNPGKSASMGQERDHIATHYFPGGSAFYHEREGDDKQAEMAKEMLQAAALLEAEARKTDSGIELITTVSNVGAGHKIPTGVTYIRKMWLEVTVTNGNGEVVYTSGHLDDDNNVDKDAVFYRLLFKDADGNLTNKSWLAEEIAYDRRIPAQGSDEETFDIAVDGDNLSVNVRLLYRSLTQESLDNFDLGGLKVPSIEMARTEVQVN